MSFACAPNPGRVVLDVRFAANTKEAAVSVTTLAGYVAGITDVNIFVAAGVTLWSDDPSKGGLTITGSGNAGDRVRLVNKGTIMGRGGDGGGLSVNAALNNYDTVAPTAGGPGLLLSSVAIEIDNTGGTIAGGGGGGAYGWNTGGGLNNGSGGGGGAGGGTGGSIVRPDSLATAGGAGGAVGASGANGVGNVTSSGAGGGGGGRIRPGADVAGPTAHNLVNQPGAQGGQAGGAGAAGLGSFGLGGTRYWCAAGGGGGWGQKGGDGYVRTDGAGAVTQAIGGTGSATTAGGDGQIAGATVADTVGAAGGKAIQVNIGASRTITFAGTMYGATS